MKIRTRLSLQFTIIVASILIFFSISIYFFSSNYTHQEFYARLKDKALTTGKLFIEVQEVDSALLKLIDRNTVNLLPREQVVIYYADNREAYRSNDLDRRVLTTEELNLVKREKEVRFEEDNYMFDGLLYKTREKEYVIVASAIDMYGISKLRNLRVVLIIGLLCAVGATLVSGWIFSGQALRPISQVVKEANTISGFNLNKRLGEGNRRDEIANMAITFNQMLDRIEQAFEIQRSFIANASHELRTPLTSITGQLEVALLNKRDEKEYETTLTSILEDIRSLNQITNGLLEIAQIDTDIGAIKMKSFRVDEILWEVRQDLSRRYPNYRINLHFPVMPTDEEELCLIGLEPLFKTAIGNLVDNACKYSPNHAVDVTLNFYKHNLEIIFEDEGIGVPDSEMEKIFEPFYRASNAQNFRGQGLGLSLTRRTVEMHRGTIEIESKQNEGTIFRLLFPAMGEEAVA